MLLSFSMPSMLPMIQAGLGQRRGEDIGERRVKRQTIRRMGPRGRMLTEGAGRDSFTIPYDLHLWWKSRTPEKTFIGKVVAGSPAPIFCYPIQILHSEVIGSGYRYDIWRIDGPRGWRAGDAMLFWSHHDERQTEPNDFAREAMADGFDSPRAFCDYFAPNMGDVFEGVLFKW